MYKKIHDCFKDESSLASLMKLLKFETDDIECCSLKFYLIPIKRKDNKKLLDSFVKFSNYAGNPNVITSKIYQVLKSNESEVWVNSLKTEDIRALSKTWDLLIYISKLLDLYQYLKSNDIENATIDEVIQSELNLEEQYKVDIYTLQCLKTLADVLNNCIGKIKNNQTEISEFIMDLAAYVDR